MQPLSQILYACGISLLTLLATSSQAQDARDDLLKRLLERYPEADANKDGKLSLEEARAYRLKMTGKTEGASKPAATAPQQPGTGAERAARAAKKARRAAGPEIKPDRADLSYGPHASNKLDLWLPK